MNECAGELLAQPDDHISREVKLLRSEHERMRHLAATVVEVSSDPTFASLRDQLCWMIRDHTQIERSLLRSIRREDLPSGVALGIEELDRLVEVLEVDDVIDPGLIARVIDHHCGHLEREVFAVIDQRQGG